MYSGMQKKNFLVAWYSIKRILNNEFKLVHGNSRVYVKDSMLQVKEVKVNHDYRAAISKIMFEH